MTTEPQPAEQPAPARTYRLDLRHVMRMFGTRMTIAAALVVVAAVAFGIDSETAGTVAVVAAVLAVAMILFALWPLILAPAVVSVDAHGYRVHRVPGCGVRSAAWTDVERVDDKAGELGQMLVISLAGGAATLVPLVLVASQAIELQRDMRERLNQAHGYRPLG